MAKKETQNTQQAKRSHVHKPVILASRNSFGQWIDFNKNPPESGQLVLLYNKDVINGKYGIRFYFDGEFFDENGRSTKGMFVIEFWTHWMPLPNFEARSK